MTSISWSFCSGSKLRANEDKSLKCMIEEECWRQQLVEHKNYTQEYKANGLYCQSSNGFLKDVPFTATKGFNFTMPASHSGSH